MNRLKFFSRRDRQDRQGFDIVVTEPSHPYIGNWWPPGHLLGYEHTFVHTIADFVNHRAQRAAASLDQTLIL